jgi:hypothetical protein
MELTYPETPTAILQGANERSAVRWIKCAVIGCIALPELIAGTASYLHIPTLVALHEPARLGRRAHSASVNGMLAAASTTMLADSRSRAGEVLPWTLLVVSSLAANVAVVVAGRADRVGAGFRCCGRCVGSRGPTRR